MEVGQVFRNVHAFLNITAARLAENTFSARLLKRMCCCAITEVPQIQEKSRASLETVLTIFNARLNRQTMEESENSKNVDRWTSKWF